MKRRHFLGVTAVGAAAEMPYWSSAAAASQQGWRPDGVGSIARIGVLTPAFDPVPESEAWAMAPKGVSIHAARVRYQREDPRLFAESSRVDSAVELLAAVKPQSIMYAFTSSSYVLRVDGDEALRTRLERIAGGRCLRRRYTAGRQRPCRKRQMRCSSPVMGYVPLASLTPLRKP
jgi:hypothetical protein